MYCCMCGAKRFRVLNTESRSPRRALILAAVGLPTGRQVGFLTLPSNLAHNRSSWRCCRPVRRLSRALLGEGAHDNVVVIDRARRSLTALVAEPKPYRDAVQARNASVRLEHSLLSREHRVRHVDRAGIPLRQRDHNGAVAERYELEPQSNPGPRLER